VNLPRFLLSMTIKRNFVASVFSFIELIQCPLQSALLQIGVDMEVGVGGRRYRRRSWHKLSAEYLNFRLSLLKLAYNWTSDTSLCSW